MSAVTPKPREALPQDRAEAARLDHALLEAAYDAGFDGAIAALEAAADIDFADPDTGLVALRIAVGTNQLALVRELIEEWGAIVRPDGRGRWPTVIAARSGGDDDSLRPHRRGRGEGAVGINSTRWKIGSDQV